MTKINSKLFSADAKVCAVIVTYGERAELVKKTVNSAKNEGVNHVIIIDNNSAEKSFKELQKLKKNNPSFITLKKLSKNRGSAGGFKAGLEVASKRQDADYFLCLDDDNFLTKNSLQNLLKYHYSLSIQQEKNKIILFCLRTAYQKDFLLKTEKELKLKNLERDTLIKNSYCYFSLFKVFTIINGRFIKRKNNNKKYYQVACGAYGGMFFHKSMFQYIGYPDENFFTYFDDIYYTYNLHQKGINLYLIPSATINDLETTLPNADVKSYFSLKKIFQNIYSMNETKLFYGYRNRIILEKKIKDSDFEYTLNKIIFKFLIQIVKIAYFMYYGNKDKIRQIESAIQAGEKFQIKKTLLKVTP
jgi:GT2 family glycosyltransferase